MKKYCIVCVALTHILRAFSCIYLEKGVSNKKKIETKVDFFIKEKTPRFIHWSEIFV
ncbi:MAG: hypothetical protein IT451_13785 [Candidatus Brocadia sp.]|nr:hypothetical protein [Candidatus Brocadia sp.]